MRWQCQGCGSTADQKLEWCSRCCDSSPFFPLLTPPATTLALNDTAVVTAKQLFQSAVQFRSLSESVSRVTGELPVAPSLVAVYGAPGAGKSCFALKLADAWVTSDKAGLESTVLYNSLEEGAQPSMAGKLRYLEILNERILIVVRNNLTALVDLAQELAASLLVIDSVSFSALGAEDLARISREVPATVVYLMHQTKGGLARGSTSLTHAADVVIRVEQDGWWREKSRFSGPAEGAW